MDVPGGQDEGDSGNGDRDELCLRECIADKPPVSGVFDHEIAAGGLIVAAGDLGERTIGREPTIDDESLHRVVEEDPEDKIDRRADDEQPAKRRGDRGPAPGDAGQSGKYERLQADVRDAPVVAAGVGADPEQDDRPDSSNPGGTMAGWEPPEQLPAPCEQDDPAEAAEDHEQIQLITANHQSRTYPHGLDC